jgi:hypothetical protein
VRDNQRRSRARKREYVAELERKLQEYHDKETLIGTNLPQSTLKHISDENRRLRILLGEVGVGKARIDSFLEDGFNAPESSGSVEVANRFSEQIDRCPEQRIFPGSLETVS